MRVLLFSLLLSLSAAHQLVAQGELLSTVRIIAPQLQRTDRRVFDQLETSLREWLNNTKWTGDAFTAEERIRCSFILTINKENDSNSFSGELTVQATRPVYGSAYDTPTFSHLDRDMTFTYEQNQPLEFVPTVAENPNLTSVFAFYAYVILALDYDTFSPYGGEPHWQMAQQILNNAQNTGLANMGGWKPSESGGGDKNRNRFWLIENALSPRLRQYRSALYNYHRKGLDLMMTKPEQGRAGIMQAMEDMEKASISYINAMLVQIFMNSKRDELVELWKMGTRPQKERVVQIMTRLDPSNVARYREIGI